MSNPFWLIRVLIFLNFEFFLIELLTPPLCAHDSAHEHNYL